ncbi:MAG: hypothetical protein AB7O78_09515 [Thermoleophilia bacterium]
MSRLRRALPAVLAAAVIAVVVAAASPPARAASGGPVVAVGDSVMLGASPQLRKALSPGAVIDAAVSRQFTEGAAVLRGRLRTAPRNAIVVIHLGDNGYIPFRPFERLMRDLSGRPKVVLVTVRVRAAWQDSVNDALRYAARHHRNAVIADWHAASGGRGILVDGTHTTPKGARIYARTIARAVRSG